MTDTSDNMKLIELIAGASQEAIRRGEAVYDKLKDADISEKTGKELDKNFSEAGAFLESVKKLGEFVFAFEKKLAGSQELDFEVAKHEIIQRIHLLQQS